MAYQVAVLCHVSDVSRGAAKEESYKINRVVLKLASTGSCHLQVGRSRPWGLGSGQKSKPSCRRPRTIRPDLATCHNASVLSAGCRISDRAPLISRPMTTQTPSEGQIWGRGMSSSFCIAQGKKDLGICGLMVDVIPQDVADA